MAFEFDEQEVRKSIAILKPDNQLFEVRFIHGKWNASGYFRNADDLIQAMKTAPIQPEANAYITLNALDDSLEARSQSGQIVPYASPTTSDNDVRGFEWIMVDLDPKRPAGVSSTDAQLEEAHVIAQKIFAALQGRGWSDPVVAASGNGMHLLYRVHLINTDETKKTVETVLKALNAFFGTDSCEVDLKTFNPARVCKLYGTVARKGQNTPEYPHRLSRLLYVPPEIHRTSISYLEELGGLLPAPEAPQRYNSYNPAEFDLQSWIDEHGLEVTEKTHWSGGTKWILAQCPFNPDHKHKDASILQTSDGKICFNCFHNSCSDKHWKELRELFEPDAYTQRTANRGIPNYLAGRVQSTEKTEPENVLGEPYFRTPEEIRLTPAPEGVYVKTGISGIDDRMIGLKKGYVSVLSGLRSAGKSSILSQIVVNGRQNGYKTAFFSGEMRDKQVLKWLVQQAAGKQFMRPTKYERVFYPMEGVEERISKWLDGYVYLYNNNYGTDFLKMIPVFDRIVQDKELDIILLDNLMAMDIRGLDKDVYSAQSRFVFALKDMADKRNIHVLFVAHPRKSTGYLRLEDIAGSGDLTNAVDNAFILHRVNNDYVTRTREMYGWKDSNELYQADNVIEICKDRDLGHQDEHIPLFFEPETKRLRNSRTEYVHYDWENGGMKVPEYIPVDVGDDLPW